MADSKILSLTEKVTGVATDEFVINDVAGGNLDKSMSMDGLRITESQVTDLQTYLLNIVEDTTPQLGGTLDGQGNIVDDVVESVTRASPVLAKPLVCDNTVCTSVIAAISAPADTTENL